MLDAPTRSATPRRWWLWAIPLAGIVVLAVALRAAWINHVTVDPFDGRFDDSVFYYATAIQLAEHFAYRDPWSAHFTAHWPPGYPLVLSGVFAVTGTSLLAAKVLNVAISAATVLLTYALGAKVFGWRTGLVAALLVALAPGHIFFAPLVMTEVLFTFSFLAVAAMIVWWTSDVAPASWRWWFDKADGPDFHASNFSRLQEPRMLALGIATAGLTLVRSEAVALLVVFAGFWLVVVPRWRPLLWHTAIFCAGFVIAMTPWAARNYARLDKLVVLREDQGGVATAAFDSHFGERNNPLLASQLPPPETAGYWLRHPWGLVPLEWEKLRNLYSDDSDGIGWSRQTLGGYEVRRLSHIADRYFFGVGAAALAAIPLLWRRRDRSRFALAYLIAGWTAIQIVSWPQTRYHLPLLPIICMFAGWTAVSAASAVVTTTRRMASSRARAPEIEDPRGMAEGDRPRRRLKNQGDTT